MKKNGFNPFILLDSSIGDDTVIGGRTGQGGVDTTPFVMSFTAWLDSPWKEDLIQNGVVDAYDYAAWWEAWGFSREQWESVNGEELPWSDYFDD